MVNSIVKKIKRNSLFLVIFLIVLATCFSYLLTTKYWQESQLNKDFICPEKLTKEEAESYLYRYTNFYIKNYPEITLDDFLSRRMQLLISNKCTITLQNLARDNNGILPNQDSVNELKSTPYGEKNKKLKELR